MKDLIIREGRKEDITSLFNLIIELAEYEKAPDKVSITQEQLLQDGFGDVPLFTFLVAIHQQRIVGISLFYYRYSTWKGKGLYLEDLIVTQDYRRKGVGKELLLATASYAKDHQCTGLYWQVLDWNTPAIEFYKSLGSKFDGEWINCKLDESSLRDII